MPDTIRILGLMINGRHGVHSEERTLTQPFEIDVEIRRDLSRAGETDKLEDTVDYGLVVGIVKEVFNNGHCRLLERLCGQILDRLAEEIQADHALVRIRKPRAPIDVPFDCVEVELHRDIAR